MYGRLQYSFSDADEEGELTCSGIFFAYNADDSSTDYAPYAWFYEIETASVEVQEDEEETSSGEYRGTILLNNTKPEADRYESEETEDHVTYVYNPDNRELKLMYGDEEESSTMLPVEEKTDTEDFEFVRHMLPLSYTKAAINEAAANAFYSVDGTSVQQIRDELAGSFGDQFAIALNYNYYSEKGIDYIEFKVNCDSIDLNAAYDQLGLFAEKVYNQAVEGLGGMEMNVMVLITDMFYNPVYAYDQNGFRNIKDDAPPMNEYYNEKLVDEMFED